MSWHQGDVWKATLEGLEVGIYEYKYVVVDHSTGRALDWQRGNNSVLALTEKDLEGNPAVVEVSDNWEGSPGASVTAPGELGTTRELRLSAWARGVSESLAQARGELRASRLDLAAARSEARAARLEAAEARAALAESEQRARESVGKQVDDLRAANALLRQQLAENAAAFGAALSQAAELLEDAGGSGSGAAAARSEGGARASSLPSSSSAAGPSPSRPSPPPPSPSPPPSAAATAPSRGGFGGFGFASNKR